MDFNFGFIQTTSLGTRKMMIALKCCRNMVSCSILPGSFMPLVFQFQNTVFDGNTYNGDSAFYLPLFFRRLTCFSPQGSTINLLKQHLFSFRHFTDRMTIVASKRLYEKGSYGVPPYQHSINQLGAFASINVYQKLFKTLPTGKDGFVF